MSMVLRSVWNLVAPERESTIAGPIANMDLFARAAPSHAANLALLLASYVLFMLFTGDLVGLGVAVLRQRRPRRGTCVPRGEKE
jgi:hypothetical protein